MLSIFILYLFPHFTYAQIEDSTQIRLNTLQKLGNEVSLNLKNKDYNDGLICIRTIIEEFSKLSEQDQVNYSYYLGYIYYDQACIYALLNRKDEAIDSFDKAIGNRYYNYFHALGDTDLDSLRSDERFIKLLQLLREKGDYIFLLQKSGGYRSDKPEFTYQENGDEELIEIRRFFNLDSIAGNGSEISKMKNLLYWAHNLIRHDGSNSIKVERTALKLYDYAKSSGEGLNCRGLSIFLNECYLALGFKSRYVTCMPKNSKDFDCHVINAVYSESLNKWIWLDPTNNAYVMDENNNLLSIAEVRKRLINNETLILNEDANWNNKDRVTKEEYIDNYMAKNLYWLQVPINSKAGVDGMSNEIYVSLIPFGYNDKSLKDFEYITYDEDYFWENK